ncbi:MAG: response regulator transcription factor [Desulfobacteraceae bacterium]|nr:response regulator transcription factor [Desulfobacteraceae bacterium]
MLAKQQVLPSKCPYLGKPVNEKVTFEVYDENGNPTSSVTIDVDTSKTDLKARDKNKTLDANAAPFKKNTISESDANMSLPVPLTKREYEVLSMMARGLTNKEISDELFISPHTVKSHVINIFNKLGVNHRTQAVVWAARNHLI